MIYLQWKSSLVWLRGETAIQDIWLVWFHIIMPFRTKNGTDALFTKKFCQMVIYIQYSMLSLYELNQTFISIMKFLALFSLQTNRRKMLNTN